MRQQAEDYAHQIINRDAIVREAEARAAEIIAEAEEQCRLLKRAASEYCEDALRQVEEAVADAYDEVKHSRAKFRSILGGVDEAARQQPQQAPRRAMYDAELDEDDYEDD